MVVDRQKTYGQMNKVQYAMKSHHTAPVRIIFSMNKLQLLRLRSQSVEIRVKHFYGHLNSFQVVYFLCEFSYFRIFVSYFVCRRIPERQTSRQPNTMAKFPAAKYSNSILFPNRFSEVLRHANIQAITIRIAYSSKYWLETMNKIDRILFFFSHITECQCTECTVSLLWLMHSHSVFQLVSFLFIGALIKGNMWFASRCLIGRARTHTHTHGYTIRGTRQIERAAHTHTRRWCRPQFYRDE